MHTQNFFDISEHNGCTRGVLRSPLEVLQYVATRRLVPLHPDPLPQGTYLVSVGSVAEAAYGGRPVESRKNTEPKVPSGTTDSSPRFQPWVAGGKSPEPRRGERTNEAGPTVLSSLTGLDSYSRPNPAMNRWAILERPCGTSSHDPLNTYALGGERAGMRGRFACLASMSRN